MLPNLLASAVHFIPNTRSDSEIEVMEDRAMDGYASPQHV